MINAFTIYLVLQLDSIHTMLFLIFLVGGIALALLTGVIAMVNDDFGVYSYSENPKEHSSWTWWKKHLHKMVGVVLVAGFLSALLPSTKTAAAMFIIPAVANNERVQAEFEELYTIARDGLKKMAEPDKAKEPSTSAKE